MESQRRWPIRLPAVLAGFPVFPAAGALPWVLWKRAPWGGHRGHGPWKRVRRLLSPGQLVQTLGLWIFNPVREGRLLSLPQRFRVLPRTCCHWCCHCGRCALDRATFRWV